ncbi:porin [Falsiroseomonas tokyonensis]|uniref:Porin n=1 Tax=Falsiroseomonas tokyonensis TaxID=430521 RepID=A0ABV7BS40_9PROT|nr:porin [Falsiroseomonas tokyonensis]MBU8536863.1 porin [Falsiroseomonas tokyonensis]
MRKILLGTTAVVGAALMGMGVAQAQEAPTVRVGGYFEFTAGYVNDDFDRPNVTGANRSRSKVDFRSDMEISVIVRGKAANGLSYGAEIELQMDNVTSPGGSSGVLGSGFIGAGSGGIVDTDEAWGFISSPTLGTLQFGDQDSAADQLKVAAPSVTNLGESGGWDEFVAIDGANTRYILSTINDGNDSTKIIYLSPQFFGFDFGVSYAPNTFEGENLLQNNAQQNGSLQRNANGGFIRNELSGALRYRGSFGNVGVAAAFSAMRGDAPDGVAPGFQDPNAYQVGLNLSAYGLTVGGHYVWGKFDRASFGRIGLPQGRDTSTNWTIGATYRIGAMSLGAFYALGKRDNGGALADREQRAIGVGAVYTLAPGLEAFANYTNVNDENVAGLTATGVVAANGAPGNLRNRNIDIFIIGTRLAF